jgi:hypothetical protein
MLVNKLFLLTRLFLRVFQPVTFRPKKSINSVTPNAADLRKQSDNTVVPVTIRVDQIDRSTTSRDVSVPIS